MSTPAQEICLSRTRPIVVARAFGDGTGPRVLALHGWLDNAASFDLLAPKLGSVRLVAVDLPGHGLSEHRSSDASYTLTDWVSDVARIADELGWDQFRLLGHSMGAAVAGLFAAVYPERVERLVAIEGLAPLTEKDASAPDRLAQYLRARTALPDKQTPIYPTLEAALKARMAAGRFDSEAGIEAVVKRGLKPCEGGFTWRSDPRLTLPSAQRLTHAQAAAFMERITCPTLVLRARQGWPVELEAWRDLLSRVRNLEVYEADGGHHVHLDHPDAVAALLRPFIAG